MPSTRRRRRPNGPLTRQQAEAVLRRGALFLAAGTVIAASALLLFSVHSEGTDLLVFAPMIIGALDLLQGGVAYVRAGRPPPGS